MNRVRAQLHAEEAYRAGITGRGVTVAILDSGICYHPDYADRIVAFRDFVNGKRSISEVVDLLEKTINEKGLCAITQKPAARPRRQEIFACINRYRGQAVL